MDAFSLLINTPTMFSNMGLNIESYVGPLWKLVLKTRKYVFFIKYMSSSIFLSNLV